MSKRKNPFGDTAPIQMKIHVTEKHTATEEDMQEVYRKTKAKLFNGTKELFSHRIPTQLPSPDPDLKKHLSRNCASICKCCKREQPSLVACSYCQHQTCKSTCIKECYICEQKFCQLCTVLNYKEADVRILCMNCVSTNFT